MSWPRRSGFATVRKDGDEVRKEYDLNDRSEAEEFEKRVRRYDRTLREAGFPLADLDGVSVSGNSVVLRQKYVEGPTLDRYLDRAIDPGNRPDELLTRAAEVFDRIRKVVTDVGITGDGHDDILQSHRVAVGYDWQPANFALGEDGIVGFDLVYPLELTDDRLPDLSHRERNFDAIDPVVGYFAWYSYVGVLHTVAFAILNRCSGRTSEETFDDVRTELRNRYRRAITDYGYDPSLADVVWLRTHLPVHTLHRVTDQLHVEDVSTVAGDVRNAGRV